MTAVRVVRQAVSLLLEHHVTPCTRAWRYFDPEEADHEAGWITHDAVLGAAKAGHAGVLRLLLKHLSREPVEDLTGGERRDRSANRGHADIIINGGAVDMI